ncbi:hypothetical protein V492_00310, partial [Pseudogymnoascus sp. VKM F-4246]
MADPFSTGAGIVGVIGLAIQITQVLVQFRMDWKDAPDNVKTFMAELGTLKTVLSETNTNILLNPDFAAAFQNRPSLLLSQLGPNAPSTTDTKRMLELCRKGLDSMLKELQKRVQGHRLGWERLKGAFIAKDTRDSVENLCRQCQTLNSMLSIDAAILGASMYKEVREARKEQQEWHQTGAEISLVIRDGVDESNRRQENQERQHERRGILDWLTAIDYAPQQSDIIGRRQAETGQWLLDSEKFQIWLNTEKQTLFCPGIPGAGKTILTSIVVEELTTRFSDDPTIGIAYIYFNFGRQSEQQIDDLLASLLKQLAGSQSSLPATIRDLYDRHKTKRTRPSHDDITGVLQSVAASYLRVFIIVDAVDECQTSDNCQQIFLESIFNLNKNNGVNLFVTSRPISSIENKFEENPRLEIRASEEDVRRYLDGHMFRLPGFVVQSLELQEEIKTNIVKAVDGMFLLAQLYLESLTGKRAPKTVRTALKNLATGSGAYDHAYEDAMERINGQMGEQRDLAKQVLSWITCAKRPLATIELQHALGVEVGEAELDGEYLPQIEEMVSMCAGLVTIDAESNVIRLVHYTTQEYFERTQGKWFPNVETGIATICVTYLSFNDFESGFCPTDDNFEKRLQFYKLYDYASHYWGHHARAASTLNSEVISFLKKKAHVEASSQGLMATASDTEYSQQFPKEMTGLHLAAYFGIDVVVKHLLENQTEVNVKDGYDQTPLSWAAKNGHKAVVQLLLSTAGVDADSKGTYSLTPLSWAAKKGHETVVKLLLDTGKVDADAKDETDQTPLLWAAKKGHEAVVKLLLDTGKVDADAKDETDQTPLLWAAKKGHEAVVKLLLDKGKVDADATDETDQTPLLWAAKKGHEAVVKLLLDKGKVDADATDETDQTPLLWAAKKGHEAVVKLLLGTGKVDANAKDKDDRTPLSYAAEIGNEVFVKLLLDTGKVDADATDETDQTPLLWAAKKGHEAVVKLLLGTGKVDANAKDKDDRTPLSYAAQNGNEAVVKLLLNIGKVDANAKDKDDGTPLSWAAKNGNEAVVKLLLDIGKVDANAKDKNDRTPLSWAAKNGNEAVVKLLIDTQKVDTDAKDKDDRTPLSLAAKNGNEAVVKLLINTQKVDGDAKDKDDRTLLSWAAENGHDKV